MSDAAMLSEQISPNLTGAALPKPRHLQVQDTRVPASVLLER